MKYFIESLGCAKNQVDSETMMASLDASGWQAAEAGDADLIIINSCGFIESAKRESINAVLEAHKQYPGKKIVLAGCLAQRYADDLAQSLPEADVLFGNSGGLSAISAVAAGLVPGTVSERLSFSDSFRESEAKTAPGSRPLLSLPGSAYVKISEGCGNRCSFCAIPLIRGPLRCRTIGDITAECKTLLGRGIQELCLIGQDTGSYRDPSGGGLPRLLEAVSALGGGFWVRLLYIHPDNFPLEILDLMKADPRLLPYFDIPFQHGSAKILSAMNRRGTAESYLGLISRIRSNLPDAVIRSTFLLGFPGETDADFEALLGFQRRAELDWAGCFTYSREEDTPAYGMKGRVPKKTAAARKAAVEERQVPVTEARMETFIGRELPVLVEERFEEDDGAPGGLYLGRLYCQAPEVDGAAVITSSRSLVPGRLYSGKVTARAGFDLEVRV